MAWLNWGSAPSGISTVSTAFPPVLNKQLCCRQPRVDIHEKTVKTNDTRKYPHKKVNCKDGKNTLPAKKIARVKKARLFSGILSYDPNLSRFFLNTHSFFKYLLLVSEIDICNLQF